MWRLVDGNVLMAFAMVAIFATMVFTASGYPHPVQALPLIIGIPGLVLAGIQLAIEIVRALRGETPSELQIGNGGNRPRLRREGVYFLYIVGLGGMILALGFLVAAPLFIALFLWHRENERRRVIVIAAFGALALVYVVFELLFDLSLFQGFLLPLLGS